MNKEMNDEQTKSSELPVTEDEHKKGSALPIVDDEQITGSDFPIAPPQQKRRAGRWRGWKWVALSLVIIFLVLEFADIHPFPPIRVQGRTLTEYFEEYRHNKRADIVLPKEGLTISLPWNTTGKQMVEKGVIDIDRFYELYDKRGGLFSQERSLLEESDMTKITITEENANVLLNLLWAYGLSNNNPILSEGEIQDPKYDGAEAFASVGGWTLARGEVMDHFNKYSFLQLTREQQELVEDISKNIYRPCCGNSTHFPDCNHGMAMLGLLELLVAQGYSEEQIYDIALTVNSYWFPDTYITIAEYFDRRGVDWDEVDAKEVLGPEYSSAIGYQQILIEVKPPIQRGGNSCGV